MPRAYRYVGPKEIANRARAFPPGTIVGSPGDILVWVQHSGAARDRSGRVTATTVVDATGRLRLSDRHSEHVACAGGGPVLAAGEITFSIRGGFVSVAEITNQSTGYCPEPESWPAVATALEAVGVSAPDGYTAEFLFRRCPLCGQINVVKEMAFGCAVCDSELPAYWNLDGPTPEPPPR
jgi:hypothetical protein